MKIAILSREKNSYSTRRLRQAGLERGHSVRILDTFSLSVSLETGQPRIYHQGKTVSPVHAVIPRIGASATFHGTAVVRQFEQMGTYVVTTSRGITMSRDKLHALQVLSRQGIGIAPTAFVRRADEILPAIERVGGAPVIIKLLEGTQGNGVILAENAHTAESMISALQGANKNVLIQRFVSESKGRDLRAFVVGGQVVAAMRRRATGDEFRSNLHRGGHAEAVQLSAAYEVAALRAARALGLGVAGVDMLESHDGPQVLEVNSSPGLEGIEHCTGVDVAAAIIEHIETHASFPEVDLRQRLNLGSGHEIAEVPVSKRSVLAKATLRESALRDAGIQVLSITRGGEVIMNPRGDERVLAGDVLLCLGRRTDLAAVVLKRRASGDGSAPVGCASSSRHARPSSQPPASCEAPDSSRPVVDTPLPASSGEPSDSEPPPSEPPPSERTQRSIPALEGAQPEPTPAAAHAAQLDRYGTELTADVRLPAPPRSPSEVQVPAPSGGAHTPRRDAAS